MSEQPEQQQTVEVPQFIVNLIGRLVAENEALRAGLQPAQPTVVHDDEPDAVAV